MKILNGKELAGFVKERQAHQVRSLQARRAFPKLLIIRDSDNPVITKYVNLKQRYGEDIGVVVEDCFLSSSAEIKQRIIDANSDPSISGIIVQLPLKTPEDTDDIVALIAPEKDVDGLAASVDKSSDFASATATAINWLLAGYDVRLDNQQIAIVGYGRLVGKPLAKIWQKYQPQVFRSHDDLTNLSKYDIIVTATGHAKLIVPEMVKPGCTIVDAGTASEDGVLVGDVSDEVRGLKTLHAITPKVGGVGPLTVAVLFDNVINAAQNSLNS